MLPGCFFNHCSKTLGLVLVVNFSRETEDVEGQSSKPGTVVIQEKGQSDYTMLTIWIRVVVINFPCRFAFSSFAPPPPLKNNFSKCLKDEDFYQCCLSAGRSSRPTFPCAEGEWTPRTQQGRPSTRPPPSIQPLVDPALNKTFCCQCQDTKYPGVRQCPGFLIF